MSGASSKNAIGLDLRVVPLFLAGAVLVANGLGVGIPNVVVLASIAVVAVGSVVALYLLVRGD